MAAPDPRKLGPWGQHLRAAVRVRGGGEVRRLAGDAMAGALRGSRHSVCLRIAPAADAAQEHRAPAGEPLVEPADNTARIHGVVRRRAGADVDHPGARATLSACGSRVRSEPVRSAGHRHMRHRQRADCRHPAGDGALGMAQRGAQSAAGIRGSDRGGADGDAHRGLRCGPRPGAGMARRGSATGASLLRPRRTSRPRAHRAFARGRCGHRRSRLHRAGRARAAN